MEDKDWVTFFTICAATLGKGNRAARWSETWCAWSTFNRQIEDTGYWTSGLPNIEDLTEKSIKDSPSVWGQPFFFSEIAHIIVPRQFYWESEAGPDFQFGYKPQDIRAVAEKLKAHNIAHRLTENILEVKLY